MKLPHDFGRVTKEAKDHTLPYCMVYAVLGSAWILFSDMLLMHGKGPSIVEIWSIAKGLAYVAITTLFLFAMMRGNARSLRALNQDLERRVEERTRALEAVNEELGSFTYSVSHDLRTPLRAINGFSQILKEDCSGELGAEGREHLSRIAAATLHMSALIDGLLDLSRASQVELAVTNVSLSDLAEKSLASFRAKEPGRSVETTVQPGVVVGGDARLLANLIANLLENAWKFTSRTQGARIGFGVRDVEGRNVYCVEDNGVGFRESEAAELFRPFKRLSTAAEFPGEGIGLATVRRIVQRHDGEVWAEGSEGRGARVYFTLGVSPG